MNRKPIKKLRDDVYVTHQVDLILNVSGQTGGGRDPDWATKYQVIDALNAYVKNCQSREKLARQKAYMECAKICESMCIHSHPALLMEEPSYKCKQAIELAAKELKK